MSLSTFLARPLRVAAALSRGECEGTYIESSLVIAGVISGVAALLWPGQYIDRKRFVEAWVRFAPPDAHLISTPLLRDALMKAKDRKSAGAIEALRPFAFSGGYDVRVVTSDDVDVSEADIHVALPNLALLEIRRQSYAAVFYADVRSQLTHEFQFGTDGRADSMPMTGRADARVSYTNQLDGGRTRRRVYFHTDWLLSVARTITRSAEAFIQTTPAPIPRPSRWWIEG